MGAPSTSKRSSTAADGPAKRKRRSRNVRTQVSDSSDSSDSSDGEKSDAEVEMRVRTPRCPATFGHVLTRHTQDAPIAAPQLESDSESDNEEEAVAAGSGRLFTEKVLPRARVAAAQMHAC